ncbi:MAG TPA: tetratricopeptide repeat protein [Verrucomicrobiae bacterium]|nr:tetratricopeptide repeat protein [Verrucomicrobiae bacterium]
MKSSTKRLSVLSEKLRKTNSLVKTNKFQEALAELNSLSDAFDATDFSEERAQFNYLRGLVLWRLGEKKQALEPARNALKSYLFLKSFVGVAKSQSLLGYVLIDLGNLEDAEEHLQLAVSSFKLANDWSQAARALNRIAYLYSIRGKLDFANYFNDQARTCAVRANDRYYEQLLGCSRAVHCRLAGDWKSALEKLDDFLNQSKKAADYFSHVFGLINAGHAKFLGNLLKQARDHYLEAIRVASRENLIGSLKVAYEFLAELDIAEGRYAEAEENLKKALEIGERVSPYGTIMTQCWRLMGDLRLAQKEYDRAMEAYATCRSYLIKLPEKLEEGAMYRGMGICHIRKDQFSLAQAAFKKAIEIFEACENDWELAKTYVEAAECGAFALAELRSKLAWAKGIFHELEHPSWEKRVEVLLGHSEPSSNGIPLRLAHEMADRQRVTQALFETGGNISHAAEKLGISRPALHYKIKRYKLAV